MTIVELVIAVLILAIAVLGLISVLSVTTTLTETSQEGAIALQALRSKVEEMQAIPFSEVFATYQNAQRNFSVPGLLPRAKDSDGCVGEVLFPDPPSGQVGLAENSVDALLGMPRDLNGDNVVDGADHSTDYVLLPVRIRLEWTGVSGERTIELRTLLARR